MAKECLSHRLIEKLLRGTIRTPFLKMKVLQRGYGFCKVSTASGNDKPAIVVGELEGVEERWMIMLDDVKRLRPMKTCDVAHSTQG